MTKTAGWDGEPHLTPNQELTVEKIKSIVDPVERGEDGELHDMLADAVSEALEGNAKRYRTDIVTDFSESVSHKIQILQSVLDNLKKLTSTRVQGS
jgi:hypothetical protein